MIRTLLSLILVGMMAGSPAVAAPSNKKQARKLYKQGKRHFKKKDFAAAVAAFKRSYELFPHRNTVYNIALSLAHQGERIAAFGYLRKYQEKVTPRDPPLDGILQKVRDGYGVLKVVIPDPQAGVYVDGRRVGRGTLQRILPSGTRALEIRQGEQVVARKELVLPGGKVARWELGTLKVVTRKAGDDIYLDGRLVGRGKLSRLTTLGSHVVEVRRANQVIQRKELRVVSGKITEWRPAKVVPRRVPVSGGGTDNGKGKGKGADSATATPLGRLHWAWLTTLAAVTVAAAAGATVTSLETRKIWEDFKNGGQNDRDLADRGDRMQIAANALWGVSAALAAGTILVAIFTRWRTPREKARVTVAPLFRAKQRGRHPDVEALMTGTRAIWAGLLLLGALTTGCTYDFTVLCGNNALDDGEECDGPTATTCTALGYTGPDAVLCDTDCTWDISGCEVGPCGNGAINPGESCDGTVLGAANCVTEGWAAGTLACDSSCAFVTSLCTDDCGPPSAVSCPASSISDDFDDGVLAALWGASYATGDTTYAEDQGYLMLSLPVNAPGYAAYLTHDSYQLNTYGVSAELVVFPHTVVADCSFEVKDESTDDVAGISLSGLDLSFFSNVNQTQHVEITVYFQGNLHRYWRLGAAGDTFFAEVSGDGTDWVPLGSMPAPFQMEHVQIALKAGSTEATGVTGSLALFDNFNILP